MTAEPRHLYRRLLKAFDLEPLDSDQYNDVLDHWMLLHGDSTQALDPSDYRFLNAQAVTEKSRRPLHLDLGSDDAEKAMTRMFMRLRKKYPAASWLTPIGLQVNPPPEFGSARKADSDAPWVLMLDLDIAGDGHKSEDLPNADEVADIIRWIEKRLGAFDAMSFTGGGIHAYRRLNGPVTDDLARLWQQLPRYYSRYTGFHIDVLSPQGQQLDRLVGSTNTKYGYRVRWLTYNLDRPALPVQKAEAAVTRMLERLGWEPPKPVTATPIQNEASSRPASTGDGVRTFDAFNATLTPFEFLQRVLPLAPHPSSAGRWMVLSDGASSGDHHIEVGEGGSVRIWGAKVIPLLTRGFGDAYLERGIRYRSTSSLVTAMYGDTRLLKRVISETQRRGGTMSEVVEALVDGRAATNINA